MVELLGAPLVVTMSYSFVVKLLRGCFNKKTMILSSEFKLILIAPDLCVDWAEVIYINVKYINIISANILHNLTVGHCITNEL